MALRNLEAEKNAIATFTKSYGKLPQTSQEWSVVHRYAYPTYSDLPQELRGATSEATYQVPVTNLVKGAATGVNPEALTTQQRIEQQMQGYQQTAQTAKSAADTAAQQQQQMTVGGGSFFNTLQNAIREKVGAKEQGIAKSSLFEQAGLTGYDTLHESIAQRGKELESSRADLQNVITGLGDAWKAQATAVKDQYDQSFEQWKFAQQQMDTSLRELKQHEDAIANLKLQNQLAKDLEAYKNAHPSIAEQITAAKEGLEITPDGVTKPGSQVVGGFDLKGYAADPQQAARVASLLQGMGKFETLADVDAYIKRKQPNSPITGDMISKASEKYGLPWEMLVALMEHESVLGTSGVAIKNNNYGGITWSQSYQSAHPNATKGSARPAAEGGNYVKFATPQDGLNAMAELLDKRRVSETASDSGNAQIAQAIFSGTSAMTLKDIPEKNRAAVQVELNKLKDAALAAGDIAGTIRASAGGKDVDADFIKSFEKGVNTLSQLADLDKAIKKEATGPIWGIVRSANPYDTKAQQIKAQLTALVPNLARGVYGEVGVLTDNDVALYSRTLPNLKSTEDVRKAVLAMTLRSIQRSLENKIKVAAGFGRDVSGIQPQYDEIKAKVAEVESSLGISERGTQQSNVNLDDLDFSGMK